MGWKVARSRVQEVDAEHGLGASADEIAAAEAQLGPLPEDYRSFLLEFGWLAIGSDEIYGLGADVPFHLDVRRLAKSEREEAGRPLPSFLVPMRNDGAGNLDCIDTRPTAGDRDAPIVTWYHDGGPDHELHVIAASFSDWLLERIDKQEDLIWRSR